MAISPRAQMAAMASARIDSRRSSALGRTSSQSPTRPMNNTPNALSVCALLQTMMTGMLHHRGVADRFARARSTHKAHPAIPTNEATCGRGWHRARLENEESENRDREGGQCAAADATGAIDDDEGREQQERLKGLDAGVTAQPPRRVDGTVPEPGGERLWIVGICRAEDVGAHDAAGVFSRPCARCQPRSGS